jgi:hypothetical protein
MLKVTVFSQKVPAEESSCDWVKEDDWKTGINDHASFCQPSGKTGDETGKSKRREEIRLEGPF